MPADPRNPWQRVIEPLREWFYFAALGGVSLLLVLWGGYQWGLTWSHWYDIYFWAWALGLLGIWLAPQLPAARPSDLALVALWLVAVSLRCWNLFSIPMETGDVLLRQTVVDVLNIPQAGNENNVFMARWGLYLAPSFIGAAVTGDYFTGFRSAAVAWDALALAGLALLARRIGPPQLAFVALALIGISWWDNASARVHPIMAGACGAAWSWWAVLRACDEGRKEDAILAGVLIGLALRLYEPVKVLVVIMPLWWVYHAAVTRRFAANTWRSAALITAVTLMTLWPLWTHGGRVFFFQALDEGIVQPYDRGETLAADPLGHLARLSRVVTGDHPDILVNAFVRVPLINVIEVGLILVGLALTGVNWRNPRATIAAIWLFGTLVAVAVSSQPEAGRRLSVALPAIGVLAGTGLLVVARWRRYGLLLAVAVLIADAYLNARAFCSWSAACG